MNHYEAIARFLLSAAVAAASFSVFAEGVTLLGVCPGEDSSKEMRIVWHSESPSCKLLFGLEGRGKMRPAKFEKIATPVLMLNGRFPVRSP